MADAEVYRPGMPNEILKRFLPPGEKDDAHRPEFGLVEDNAWTTAAKVMTDVWKNEETRFSNLNTRAVAVLSAASLVTAVLGFFSKNVLDTGATRLSETQQAFAKAGIYAALAMLALTTAAVVFGVLLPGKRYIFGGNELTGYIDQAGTWHAGSSLSASAIDQLACKEFGAIYVELANRSRRKAYWLQLGYVFFAAAVAASIVAAVLVISQVPAAAGTR